MASPRADNRGSGDNMRRADAVVRVQSIFFMMMFLALSFFPLYPSSLLMRYFVRVALFFKVLVSPLRQTLYKHTPQNYDISAKSYK